MVIEDNPQNARLVSKLLKRAGHEVLVARDGETALDFVLDARPDLILADLGLPDIEGQVVVSIIARMPHMANVPIIAFTAWPLETVNEMSKAYGCHGVITKPIDTRTFADDVEKFLSKVTA